MTEKPGAREYFLECLDPEVVRQPEQVLRLRRARRGGGSPAEESGAAELEEPEEIDWIEEEEELYDDGRTSVPNRAVSEGFKMFVLIYFLIVFLRAIYKSASGDGS